MEVRVPDIGDFTDIPVIEILVSPGDQVAPEDALVTLESDKATMDVPSPAAGTIESIEVSVGDTVSEGHLVVTLKPLSGADSDAANAITATADSEGAAPVDAPPAEAAPASSPGLNVVAVTVPDIGEFTDIPVIELLVEVGQHVDAEDGLVTLESDKATMDVPAPVAGTVVELLVAVGNTVSEGSLIAKIECVEGQRATADTASTAKKPQAAQNSAPAGPEPTVNRSGESDAPTGRPSPTAGMALAAAPKRGPSHAPPGVRRFARELGVDIGQVTGTGRKGRILEKDVKDFVKAAVSTGGSAGVSSVAGGAGIPTMPEVDFSKWGPVEQQPLSRIKRVSGPHLHRAWLNVPHVTNHDEVDITEMEAFRRSLKKDAEAAGVKVTPLALVMKALARALKDFPEFNASLSADGQNLVLKQYCHLGIAVDTPNGLIVPVVRDVDSKGILELAGELGTLSAKAREGKLSPAELQGGCMSISSLGGIGGVGFTPIVNAPEVAILGVSRSRMTPIWDGEAFAPRLMLPLDLSYDHRVIDGAQAARFLVHLGQLMADLRRLLL